MKQRGEPGKTGGVKRTVFRQQKHRCAERKAGQCTVQTGRDDEFGVLVRREEVFHCADALIPLLNPADASVHVPDLPNFDMAAVPADPFRDGGIRIRDAGVGFGDVAPEFPGKRKGQAAGEPGADIFAFQQSRCLLIPASDGFIAAKCVAADPVEERSVRIFLGKRRTLGKMHGEIQGTDAVGRRPVPFAVEPPGVHDRVDRLAVPGTERIDVVAVNQIICTRQKLERGICLNVVPDVVKVIFHD